MNKFIKWIINHHTNLLASLYLILIQMVACVFHVAKVWTDKDWPVKCLKAIDVPAQKLKQFYKPEKGKA